MEDEAFLDLIFKELSDAGVDANGLDEIVVEEF